MIKKLADSGYWLSKKEREKLFNVAASKAYEAEQRGDTKEMFKYRREMMDLCSY